MTKGQIVDQLDPWAEYFKRRAKRANTDDRMMESMQNMVWAGVIITAMRDIVANKTTEEELRKKFPLQMSSDPPPDAEEQTAGE